MHRSDFVAVVRHPRSSFARLKGKVHAYRFLRRYYRDLRRRNVDLEFIWDRLQRWTDRALRQTPPAALQSPRGARVEERVGFRAVLRRVSRALSEYDLRFPYEPHRRLASLEQDLAELRGTRLPRVV